MDRHETDPSGRDPHSPGAKLDSGKPEPELVMRGFADALAAVVEIASFGARKYTRDGWAEVPDAERRYTNALYRHLSAWHQGEADDPDSGLPHLAHAAWNLLAILQFHLQNQRTD